MSSKIFLAVTASLFSALPARAAIIMVDDRYDNWAGVSDRVHGDDGKCTLREAVASAYVATLTNYVAPAYPQGYKINDCAPGDGDDSIIFRSNLQEIEIDTEVLGSINLTYHQYPFDPGALTGSDKKVQRLQISSG